MIDKCMNNSYKVMTSLLKEKTVENILEKDNQAMFYGNPLDYTIEDIECNCKETYCNLCATHD